MMMMTMMIIMLLMKIMIIVIMVVVMVQIDRCGTFMVIATLQVHAHLPLTFLMRPQFNAVSQTPLAQNTLKGVKKRKKSAQQKVVKKRKKTKSKWACSR